MIGVVLLKTLNHTTQLALFEAMLDGSNVATSVTDPSQKDNPIIYTNKTFEKLTGYPLTESLGHNCRFLQGPETDSHSVEKIKLAIQNKEGITTTLKNYRKDGSPFWNQLHIEPVTVEGHLYFIGTQTDVTIEYIQREELQEKEQEINRLLLPILTIRENLGAVTLVGNMTNSRFDILTTKLSEYVQQHRTQHMIIDISGVLWEQDYLSARLLMIQDVLRLMGSKLYVTGISPKLAIKLTEIQNNTQQILTFATVQQAIEFSDQLAELK